MDAKPHAVCIPFPVQGHINPMFHLAKLLHATGFHITFVNTEYTHLRFLHARGPAAVAISSSEVPDFRFRTIPDGLPLPDPDTPALPNNRDVVALCASTQTNWLGPFRELLAELNRGAGPPVSCVVADGLLGFAVKAAKELGVPGAQFWTASASNFVAYLHFPEVVARGLFPFTDETEMDTSVDWLMGMKGMRLKDLPLSSSTLPVPVYDQNHFGATETRNCSNSSAIIFNTNRAQEGRVLDAMAASGFFPPIYPTGPLSSLLLASNAATTTSTPPEKANTHYESESLGLSLWNEDPRPLQWLDRQAPGSVVYVNIGSVAVVTTQQLQELAWGLATCGHPFLWVMRSDAVTAGGAGDEALLSRQFYDAVGDRGLVVRWCAQRLVLSHPAVGVFVTHCGWNSVVESMSAGVPMVCWPFFGDQLMNCRYACAEWGIGVELRQDFKREEIGELLMGVMEGEEGRRLGRKAMEWKKEAEANVEHGGLSWTNFNNLVNEVLLGKP